MSYNLNVLFKDTDTLKQTETIVIGGFNTLDLKISTDTILSFELWGGYESYKVFSGDGTTNISDFTQLALETILADKTMSKLFPITDHSHIFIRLTQTLGETANVNIIANKSLDKHFISAGVRDKTLALDEIVSHTRPTTNWAIDVADDNISGFSNVVVKAKGSLSTVESLLVRNMISSGFKDVNRTARINSFTSTSIQDSGTGTGARRININGLAVDKTLSQTSVLLNGTSTVNLTDGLIWINSMTVDSVAQGGLGFNAGDIISYNTSVADANFMCLIEGGEGVSFNPQYEVPSGFNLYVTKMSILGSCQDSGYVKIAKYTYENNDQTQSTMRYSLLDKFNVMPSMNYDRTVNFTIVDGERLVILKKSSGVITGTNDITVALYGYLKKVSLTIASNL
tara:strand:- start:2103 stop:3296 length:1194 start_codon:yes stop_codon:yes gene_type:complete